MERYRILRASSANSGVEFRGVVFPIGVNKSSYRWKASGIGQPEWRIFHQDNYRSHGFLNIWQRMVQHFRINIYFDRYRILIMERSIYKIHISKCLWNSYKNAMHFCSAPINLFLFHLNSYLWRIGFILLIWYLGKFGGVSKG